ncbi:MipA/OmpV family protein [Stenotrophomonas rhizophila]|uniref:MipA/OmpV family protein n=1 Tax=Stenotrophomonas rhizophila TaxID=216778 RepID=UPI001E6296FD|nr:MipA/OmpV family protein [Stenotrophomonas rhizophila]MCC7632515.1 MipA/OmpV family protein [Stenotrophomonas rhizophila]MCC7663367.1 MipA/OmpV family protein [Stenotrophomonas rhizophila]
MNSICLILAVAPLSLASIATAHAANENPDPDRWGLEVMLGAGVAPRYSGSEDYTAVPQLGFEVSAPGGWFLGSSGLGWGTTLGEHGNLRAYLGGSGSRRDKDSLLGGSDHLRGMGDIRTRLLVGVGGSVSIGPTVLSATAQYAPKDKDRGDTGLATKQLQLSLEVPLFDVAGGSLSASVSTEYGDAGYMQTWYGVSAAQAARSGFARHTASAGLTSAGLGLKWVRPINASSSWLIGVEGNRLLGDAADSPIVQKQTQLGAMSGYQYRW